jgi:hypothetical protein
VGRTEFYDLKNKLLIRFGHFEGHQIQEIRKHCWGEYECGCKPACRRCCGSGIYDLFWVTLERWQWGRFSFHRPVGRSRIKPDLVQIHGYIEHKKYGRASGEAVLWLYLFCGEWRRLWRTLTITKCCGWYAWPLLNIQRLIFNGRIFFSWRKCWCGSWFPTWGSGWCVCYKCRLPRAREVRDEDIPF